GGLAWFDPVANTPGFFRALAATINELRLNAIDPDSIRSAGPSGQDLANLLQNFDRNLKDAAVADLAAAYKVATTVIGEVDFRFRGQPLLLLDIVPTSYLEQEIIRALAQAASAVLATANQRDQSSIHILENALAEKAEQLPSQVSPRALIRLR